MTPGRGATKGFTNMDQILVEAAKTNSPSIIFCSGLVALVYYAIKGQREKTATKRDSDKRDTDVKIALQEKDIENLKSQVNILTSRWDTLQDLLNKINENLASIRENLNNLGSRITRIEESRDFNCK
jgi:predicted RNase H-like nuclease (RuvC/YqgF family)